MRQTQLRIICVHEHVDSEPPARLTTPAQSFVVCRKWLEGEPVEVFLTICLNTKAEVIGYHEVSRGTLDLTLVHPREVFKPAILTNAASIIVAHNHPSGDPTPSLEDGATTRRLKEAGELLGIPVLDHLVVGGNGRYYSSRESGEL